VSSGGAGAAGSLPPSLFAFVQFEFPWELGPVPGRYVLRDSAAEADLRVVVLKTLGARERRLFGRRRTQRLEPAPEPALVPTTRATLIRGVPLAGAEAGRAWMAASEEHVPVELAVLNDVVQAHRIASADPYVRPVLAEQALVVRIGYGAGEEVAEGRWTEAVEPGEKEGAAVRRLRAQRTAALQPQERLAALLGGRDAALACEELALRARADLEAGRSREAALELRVALEAALAELEAWRGRRDLDERLEELRGERGVVGEAANAALRGGLATESVAEVERVLGRVEAAIRARAVGAT
jgi:predicted metal-dependent hydrolase